MNTATNPYHQSASAIASEETEVSAAQQDLRQFAPLYDRYYISIFRFVFKRVESEDTAGEITAQVFAKALAKIGQYESRGLPFSSWLFRIARNELNLLFRSQKNQRIVSIESVQVTELTESDSEDVKTKEQQMEWLVEGLRALSAEEVELIEMKYFEQRSYREIGEIVDLEEGNARVKVFRIVKKLKSIMHEMHAKKH